MDKRDRSILAERMHTLTWKVALKGKIERMFIFYLTLAVIASWFLFTEGII